MLRTLLLLHFAALEVPVFSFHILANFPVFFWIRANSSFGISETSTGFHFKVGLCSISSLEMTTKVLFEVFSIQSTVSGSGNFHSSVDVHFFALFFRLFPSSVHRWLSMDLEIQWSQDFYTLLVNICIKVGVFWHNKTYL